MLPGTTTTGVVIIIIGDRPPGLQKDRLKNRWNQKRPVQMMKRQSRTGALPRPGNPAVAAGESHRNGSSRNGPTIFTVSKGLCFGPGCDDTRGFPIFFLDFFCADNFRGLFHGFFNGDLFFTGKIRGTAGKKSFEVNVNFPLIFRPMNMGKLSRFPSQKKGVYCDRKNPESGHFTGFDFCISPIWAPI